MQILNIHKQAEFTKNNGHVSHEQMDMQRWFLHNINARGLETTVYLAYQASLVTGVALSSLCKHPPLITCWQRYAVSVSVFMLIVPKQIVIFPFTALLFTVLG